MNKDKCGFSHRHLKFLGQVLTESRLQTDPDKVAAIHKIELANVSNVRRFLGGKPTQQIPNLTDISNNSGTSYQGTVFGAGTNLNKKPLLTIRKL